jgi:MOSC domain-containing protein YiiM
MKGTVRALFVAPEKKAAPVSLSEVRVAAEGFEGDFHTRTAANRRQILMVSHAVLDEFQLSPGTLFENMTIEGIDVMGLAAGQRLQVGDTVLEVTVPCEPCVQMDRIRDGLKRSLEGKRGMFARVLSSGVIRVGDAVVL